MNFCSFAASERLVFSLLGETQRIFAARSRPLGVTFFCFLGDDAAFQSEIRPESMHRQGVQRHSLGHVGGTDAFEGSGSIFPAEQFGR